MSEMWAPVQRGEPKSERPGKSSEAVGRLLRMATSERVRRWGLIALAAYAAVGFSVWIQRSGDFGGYLIVGELVLSGRHIYRDVSADPNTWPPFFSLVCVPLALMARVTPYLARGFWLALNLLSLWWVLRQIALLIHGKRLLWSARGFSLVSPEMLVPLLLTSRFIGSNFEHLQINILLFALALGGLLWIRQGRCWRGGVALGFAAAVKVMPVVFVPYLLWRRHWRGALATVAAGGLFSLAPILVFGPLRFWDYVLAWREKLSMGWGVGKMNQSVFAMWDRYLGHGMVPLLTPGVNDVPESASPWVVLAVAATWLVFACVIWRRWQGPPRCNWQTAAEWSVVFAIGALVSPVTWKAYLVVLLLAHTLLFAAFQQCTPRGGWRRGLGATLILAGASNLLSPGFLGRDWAWRLEMASVPTLVALCTMGVVAWTWPLLPELESRARRAGGR